ncbi:MAG: hypothetical protein J0G29_04500, partial [Alphaproteobacteria bacterium]|nr:hypothetical protein [Alphaproteobacteria bacterium]
LVTLAKAGGQGSFFSRKSFFGEKIHGSRICVREDKERVAGMAKSEGCWSVTLALFPVILAYAGIHKNTEIQLFYKL